MNPTDFLGREIRPGDLIVYPWRRGSAMGLNKMNVMQVTPDSIGGYSNLGRPVKITNLKNVVVVERPQSEPETSDMPLYDLQCSACGHTFEAFQAMDAKQPTRCEKCGRKKVRRVLAEAACGPQQLRGRATREARDRHRPKRR